MENNDNIVTATSDNINQSLPSQAGEGEKVNSADHQTAKAEESPFLEIKYLKQTKALTKEQAKELSELGMHYSTFKERLDSLANASGKNAKQFLESLSENSENKTDEPTDEPADPSQRIANEFLKMREDFDEIKSISDISPEVLAAANSGMPLAYAYLLNKYLTEKQQSEIAAAKENAANSSVGSLAANQTEDPIADRFIKSLWGS